MKYYQELLYEFWSWREDEQKFEFLLNMILHDYIF